MQSVIALFVAITALSLISLKKILLVDNNPGNS